MKNKNDAQINIKAMSLHATSFGLYMLCIFIMVFVYVMYQFMQKMGFIPYNICLSTTYICSSISQMVLCVIFWELGKKREPQLKKKLEESILEIPAEKAQTKKTKPSLKDSFVDSEDEEVP